MDKVAKLSARMLDHKFSRVRYERFVDSPEYDIDILTS